ADDPAVEGLGEGRMTIATACSLLHVPYSAAREERLDPELRGWLAFGDEKLAELGLLAAAAPLDTAGRDQALAPARAAAEGRRSSPRGRSAAGGGRHAAVAGRLRRTPAPA